MLSRFVGWLLIAAVALYLMGLPWFLVWEPKSVWVGFGFGALVALIGLHEIWDEYLSNLEITRRKN